VRTTSIQKTPPRDRRESTKLDLSATPYKYKVHLYAKFIPRPIRCAIPGIRGFILQVLPSVFSPVPDGIYFPGKVTEADEGTVDGTKVSFNDGDSHQVKRKDKPTKSAAAGSSQGTAAEEDGGSTPTWARLLMRAIPAAAIGGGVAVAMSQRKKNQPQLVPYAAPAQVYDPNQTLLGQPTPQPPYQPGYAEPATQPYQQAQPYQPPYGNQPSQLGQGF